MKNLYSSVTFFFIHSKKQKPKTQHTPPISPTTIKKKNPVHKLVMKETSWKCKHKISK